MNPLVRRPVVFINPGEGKPKGWSGSPQSIWRGRGLVLKPGREEGIPYFLLPAHGRQGLRHRERGCDAPELGFVSAHTGETSQ